MNLKTGVTSEYGWIHPDGTYYSCDHAEHHMWLASLIIEQLGLDESIDNEKVLERLGWVKTSPPCILAVHPATREQLDSAMEASLLIENEETRETFVRRIRLRERHLDRGG